MVGLCVIYNPAAGRGKAERHFRSLPAAQRANAELRPTSEPGHAVELARAAADEGFATVVAAGGDGTVHEVANGLLQSGNRDVIFSIWPLGSANDYAFTLGMVERWKHGAAAGPSATLAVDVGRVTGGGRERYFVDALGVGFNGMVTKEARTIRWLRGMPLYALAFLKAMVKHFATPRMRVSFDGVVRGSPTLALSVLLAQREGGFPVRPAASLTDGLFDTLHATRLTRWHLIRYLPALATGRLPENHPKLKLDRAARVEVESEVPLCVHGDGEFFCLPEDGIASVVVELLPVRLRVEVYPPALYGGR